MARYEDRRWEADHGAPGRRDRRGGLYRTYIPDPLIGRPLALDATLDARCAEVEASVRALAVGAGARGLEGLARFLLRSEALASSRIEGLQVSPQQLALVELAEFEGLPVRGFSQNARLVANNVTALRRAGGDLSGAATITRDGIVDLYRALLPGQKPPGPRDTQNWVGGGAWNPLDAEFVPPPSDCVPALLDDLARYASGGGHSALVQAGLVHAQFETIHPFSDGNGRVGRALIHTVLTRRGLTQAAVLPVSLVLLTRSDAYVAGLTSYRYDGPPDGEAARAGVGMWLAGFLDAVDLAVDQAQAFSADVAALERLWADRLARQRQAAGRSSRARAGSSLRRILDMLPETPVMTARTVERMLGVSFPAARSALEELVAADVLTSRQVERNTTGYLAPEIFDLLTITERRLASTRWDTREVLPGRPSPRLPEPARNGSTRT
ncbi:Filamentation induced by cAMP protein Fic [Frankia canadensis]|uniref:Filamentation induced by cAMP protein Fic n=1 Tax=Frankia canadensis TaxID=1836972 RepID=A0A2I2KS07_9ACTN|nr:Filamentation induced by cAMP protein Fic [Frankia canadensis]SOU55747.1 Filamentation induced by cAMP protein Fic [Frankia canadensis]